MIVFVRLLLFALKITCAVEGINALVALGNKAGICPISPPPKSEKPKAYGLHKTS
jgi:hypothetical protein